MRRPLAAVFLVLLTACGPAERARSLSPDVSRLPPGQVAYLPPGETLRNGYPVSPAPLRAETKHTGTRWPSRRHCSKASCSSCPDRPPSPRSR